ncbi:hypothetical protein IKE67_01935 [bacterium]|nr:hypothetical protein [bacterium]
MTKLLHHTPWFDEAHAWTIAEQLNLSQIFNYVKNEGHFFLWQFMLYPFAKMHLYPYSMQILNWLFCTIALVIMWVKAPFNIFIKIFITFSAPFLFCYGVIARCYGIGILLLFTLASLFKDKLKYPKTYSLLLLLCANSSLLALFGAIPLCLMFVYEIFKTKSLNKVNLIISLGILIFGASLILYQVLNIGQWDVTVGRRTLHLSIKIFRSVFVDNRLAINSILLTGFAIPILNYFRQKKSAFIFISVSYSLFLILATGVYGCSFWHTYFFFIFLIVAFWISDDNNVNELTEKSAYIAFGIVSLLFVIHIPDLSRYEYIYKSPAIKIIDFIEKDEILNKANFIQNDGAYYEMLPYIRNKSFRMRNYCWLKENTDYNLINILDNKFCPTKNAMWQTRLHPEIVKELIDNNTYTYILNETLETKGNYIEMKQKEYSFVFKKYKDFDKYSFWKIELK